MAHLHQSLCVTSKNKIERERKRRKGGKKGRCLQRSSIQPNLQKQNFPEMPFCNPKRSHLHQRIQLGITNLCGLLGFVWLSQSEFFRERKQEKEPTPLSLFFPSAITPPFISLPSIAYLSSFFIKTLSAFSFPYLRCLFFSLSWEIQ